MITNQLVAQSTKSVHDPGGPFLLELGLRAAMLSDRKTNNDLFLIREQDLFVSSSSSYDGEFVDSNDEEVAMDAEKSFLLVQETTPPTLEKVLQNLSVDKLSISEASTLQYVKPARQPLSLTTPSSPDSCTTSIRSWLTMAFKWEPSTDANFVVDQGSLDSKPIILYASKMKMIEKLTTILDYGLMDTFLLTLEMNMHPMDFVTCLLSRLAQAFHAVPGWNSSTDSVAPEVVKMRGLIVLQHWAGIYGSGLEENLDFSIRSLVIEALDFIWQHSRTLSQADERFLIKIRRLYDPRGEISVTSTTTATNTGQEELCPNGIYSDDSFEYRKDNDESASSSSYMTSTTISSKSSGIKSLSERLKVHFKAIFTQKRSSTPSRKASSASHHSSLINSFSTDAECEDVSALILTERSRTLASILAVLEWDIFNAIQRSEMIIFPMVKESPQLLGEKCPNLQRSIEHFNSMCQWFVQLVASQEEDPVALLAKLIRLAIKCILIHNYNSALQIILALQSPIISGRSDLWMALPVWERKLARDLAVFGSPLKNFRNVRRAQDQICSEDLSMVPFNGLFLSDLVHNWERSINSHSNSNSNNFNDKCIPFYKAHVASKIIRQFTAFKHSKHEFKRVLSERERQLYSYFADIGRLGGEFSIMN